MCKDLWVQLQWYAVQLGTTPSNPKLLCCWNRPGAQDSQFKGFKFTVKVYQIPHSHPFTLCAPPVFATSFNWILWLGDISQHLSDGRGSAVGVFVVVFSEGAALQKIPLGVEQSTHSHARFGGVAWLAGVQGVHWHLGGGGSRVAAFPQWWGVSAGGLRGSHAGASTEAVAIRRYATEGGFLNQLGAGLGS